MNLYYFLKWFQRNKLLEVPLCFFFSPPQMKYILSEAELLSN